MINIIQIPEAITDYFSQNSALMTKVISIIVVVVVAYILTRVVRRSLRQVTAGKVKEHFRKTAFRIFQILIWIVALFVIFGIWGFDLTGLLAGAGFMGIVIGFAAQETLGNIISGLVMMFSRPFEIGDWIELSGYSGIVEEITVISTRLRTFDGEMVSIPNQMVSSSEINNKTRLGHLRFKKTVGIDYDSDPLKAKEIAENELKKHELISDDPSPRAVVDELADSSVNIVLLFWIDKSVFGERRKIVEEVITSVKKRFEEEGIGIPFPHMELIQHEGTEWRIGDKSE